MSRYRLKRYLVWTLSGPEIVLVSGCAFSRHYADRHTRRVYTLNVSPLSKKMTSPTIGDGLHLHLVYNTLKVSKVHKFGIEIDSCQ